MKKILIIIFSFVFITTQSLAVTLYEALNETYNNNKQLNAERENIKASEEDINISKAQYMPSISLSGSKSLEETNKLTNYSGGNAPVTDSDPLTTIIKLEQTLLDHERDINYDKNLIGLELSKAKLFKKEQDVLYSCLLYTSPIPRD